MSTDERSQPLAVGVKEACRLLSIGPTNFYKRARLGEIRTVRLGMRILVPRSEIDAILSGARQVAK